MTEKEYVALLDCITQKEIQLKQQRIELANDYLESVRKFKKGDEVRPKSDESYVGIVVSAKLHGTGIQYTVKWTSGIGHHWEIELKSAHKYSVAFELKERAKDVQEQIKRLEEAKKVSQETMLTTIDI